MKVLVNRKYGTAEVPNVEEVAKPVPGNREVLIQVMAASVNRGDWYLLTGKPFFLRLNPGDLLVIKEMVERGQLMPVVDGYYPLDEAAAAMTYVGTGRVRGKVVISIEESGEQQARSNAAFTTEMAARPD